MQGRRVTTIPAVRDRFTAQPIHQTQKRRVAAYARVSTDHEEQLTSYEAQVDYYTGYIKSREDWEFVHVYTDEGISATGIAKREGFRKMVEDALAGSIDLIVTKSVSRFARNTVDSLSTIRKLKEKGCECYLKGKYLDIRFQRGASYHHHVIACLGGEPEHFRERHMGAAETVLRWQGLRPLQPFPWI